MNISNQTKKCEGCHTLPENNILTICANCNGSYCESCLNHHITSNLSELKCHICNECYSKLINDVEVS